ncbi:transcriptional regulator GcvA [Kiloniella sp. b19]|uniref:transcriptional regulator GcvA n=1 Tax=Kiloniella sp. GXU_MW_B19 TaxID=3141326 RepID=UPI0031D78A60
MIPSLSALKTFEAAARHLSFTQAAQELNVTQSAVSRQIRQLEDEVGLVLFERHHQRLVLTQAGRSYAEEVREGLEKLHGATLRLMAYRGVGGELTLACLPTFGSRWLIPRLPDFTSHHPEIHLNLITRLGPFDFGNDPVDAAIHFGTGQWPGAKSDFLMGEELLPVCSPDFHNRLINSGDVICKNNKISAEDIANGLPLIHLTSRPMAWSEWFETQDITAPKATIGPRFEHFHMVIHAAISGMGIALLPKFLIEEELNNSSLCQLLPGANNEKLAYHLVYPQEKATLPRLQAFRKWLMKMARAAS